RTHRPLPRRRIGRAPRCRLRPIAVAAALLRQLHRALSVIEVEGLRKSFGSVVAVEGISFRAGNGVVTGLLGPNGAGKTTTLRILTTLLAPDSGSCRVDGLDVFRHPMASRKRLGVLP